MKVFQLLQIAKSEISQALYSYSNNQQCNNQCNNQNKNHHNNDETNIDNNNYSIALEAEIIICYVLSINRSDLFFALNLEIEQVQIEQIKLLIEQRKMAKPIAQIIGNKEFWGLEFNVNEHVLIPRPETELIIDLCIKYNKNYIEKFPIAEKKYLLDLGTGSGCILLSLMSELNDINFGIGIDISISALMNSISNAKKLNLSHKTNFIQTSWFDGLKPMNQFYMIVSNPPYISYSEWLNLDHQVKHFEPKIALTDYSDGLSHYRTILAQIVRFMHQDGIAVFEVGYNQCDEVIHIANNHGLKVLEIAIDLAKIKRTIVFSAC